MNKVKQKIEKSIAEYSLKAGDCDKLLASLQIRIISERKAGNDTNDLRKEQAVLFAQRQAYIQASVDFDSLLDYLEDEQN